MATNSSGHCGNFELSSSVQIIHIFLLSVAFLLSLVGNTLLIIVVYKRPELRKTVTYFIVNMAVSDFIFPLTAIPANLEGISAGSWEWPISGTAGLILCKIRNFVVAVSITVSIESLVWIAIDRFVAVVWPIKVGLISSRFRAFAIASTWIWAVVLNSPDLHFSKLITENGTIKCFADITSTRYTAYGYVKLAVTNIAPMVLITILYTAIAVTLRRQDKVLECRVAQRNDQKKRQAIKMSLCVVAFFYLFFLPFAMSLIFWKTAVSRSCSFYHHFALFSSSAVLISSTTNPIICFTFVGSFRPGLREVLSFFLRKRSKRNTYEAEPRDEIVLKRIRVISRKENNLAYNRT